MTTDALLAVCAVICALSAAGIWLLTDPTSYLSQLADREPTREGTPR